MPDTTTVETTTENTNAIPDNIHGYLTDDELNDYITGNDTSDDTYLVSKIMSTSTNGIEALPYQFMDTVDRRIPNTTGASSGLGVGRKYGEKIFARLPLLFITPCEPLFMDDFKDSGSVQSVAELLLGGDNSAILEDENLIGRYYSVDYNYDEYYEYLNTMLSCLSVYLGIYNTEISIAGSNNTNKKLGQINWQQELNSDFKRFFYASENIVFYLDGLESVSESFTNETSESSIASQINGYTDTVAELKFLFGSNGSLASELINAGGESIPTITSGLSSVASGLAGGIIGSLVQNGVSTIVNGGKIIFPEIWSNSSYDRSYTIDIKLRSPDHDKLSIFLNILKPYCKILALTLPRNLSAGGSTKDYLDPNTYFSPFLVKAYSKGLFNIDMGIISSLNVTKGAQCAWNDDGLPTQIDISIEIKDLYSHMAMTSLSLFNKNNYGLLGSAVETIKGVVCNTAYMDFLANMAGLNIGQMEIGRRITMAYYLTQAMVARASSDIFTRLDEADTKLMYRLYNIL